ncbi:phytosulfokine receptor 2 [Juglans microcarpa x Juglans regia]|uniref:phytosulfokine receptor 2 n=1 Tax=Juglans microcarpa x Juglans regia TaxID=2249226 RepID=UPI001B7F1438|nr:phytosulfokine receptor 2 [Juglans microcarpa x Juglans regia]
MESGLQALIAAAASFLIVTILVAFMIIICKRHEKPTHRSRANDRARARALSRGNTELSSITVDESASFDPNLRISMIELVIATKNFSADLIVGDGSFGLVYKAQLSGATVAVKKLDPDAFQGFREFQAEMETLEKLRHENIVKILGYCVSGSERLLVYEYMEKGSLDQWLQDASSENDTSAAAWPNSGVRLPLSWETRVKIAQGVANGLAYLHGLEEPIIHRDIKASNVLLDSKFEAHIADFGLARRVGESHSHVSTQVAGTMGYMPPEYREGLTMATVKADVYSFGVLLLEIATGMRPNLPAVVDGKEVVLVEWAKKMVAQNRQMEMLDANIMREELLEANVKKYFEIASSCISEISRDRPTMAKVVELLNQISG